MGSISLRARPFIQLALAALLVPVVPAFTSVSAAEPIGAQSTLQCASSAPIYAVRSNGELWLQQHLEPETGLSSWGAERRINTGFLDARTFAGLDGVVYSAMTNGELRRRRWNGTGWDTYAGGLQYEVIDNSPDWARYTTPEFRTKVTVDAEGHFYTIEPDGNLHWRAYNSATRTWTHRVVDGDWGWLHDLTGAGRGVLYALGMPPSQPPPGVVIKHQDRPYRFHYDAASQRVLKERAQVSTGGLSLDDWNWLDHVSSPGGDILYGVKRWAGSAPTDGDLVWLSYNEVDNAFSVRTIGEDVWRSHHGVFAAPDACQRVGDTGPTRPSIISQPNAPVALLRSTNGHVHYSYVDAEGRAVYADLADVNGGASFGVAVVPGLTGVTGVTSTGENQDGRITIVSQGLDAEIRSSTKTAVNGSWGAATTLGGFVSSPAALVRLPDSTIVGYAVDESGDLWYRKQIGPNGALAAWRKSQGSPLLSNGPLTVIPITVDGYAGRLVGHDRAGNILTKVLNADGSTAGDWANLGGGSLAFRPGISVVDMSNNTPQLFATGQDGVVYTKRRTTAGWDGAAWTAIPGITASGRPSAVMAPDGTLRVVVRAVDGYVYYTRQAAPGSPAFNPWQEITNYSEQSSTDPTALAVPESHTWVIAYRTELDVPRLRRHQPATLGRSTPDFVNLPLASPPA